MDIAELGLSIRSDGVVVATDRLDRLERQSRQTERASDQLAGQFQELTATAAAYAATLASVAGALALQSYLDYEAALTEVEKQTGLTGKALKKLQTRVDRLADKLPGSSRDLLNIAAAASQVGVTSTANILKFSTVVSKLGIASDVSGDRAVIGLAKILNITGEAFNSVDTLASVIVRLGGASSASESELVHFSQRLARAGSAADLTSSQVIALAASLIDMGVEAEAGSSTMLDTLQAFSQAITKGGENAKLLSQLTGVAQKDLQKAFGENALQFLLQFLKGLDSLEKQTGQSEAALRQLGLSGSEVMSILPPLAKQNKVLARNMKAAADETKNATALEREYQRALDDLGTLLGTIVDKLRRLGRSVVNEFITPLKNSTGVLNQFLSLLTENAGTLATVLGSLAIISVIAASIRLMGLAAGAASVLLTTLSASAAAATVAFTTLGGAVSAASVLFLGFKVGQWLREEFVIVEKVGAHVAAFIGVVFDSIKIIFDRATDYIKIRLVGLNEFILNVFTKILEKIASLGEIEVFGSQLFDTSAIRSWAQELKTGAEYARDLIKATKEEIAAEGDLTDQLKSAFKERLKMVKTSIHLIETREKLNKAGKASVEIDKKIAQTQKKLAESQKKFAEQLSNTVQLKKEGNEVKEKEAQAIKEIIRLYDSYIDRVNPAAAAQRDFNRAMERLGPYLDEAAVKFGISTDKLKQFIEEEMKARHGLKELEQTSGTTWDSIIEDIGGAIGDVEGFSRSVDNLKRSLSQAFGDWAAGMTEDLGDMTDQMKGILQQFLSDIAAKFARANPAGAAGMTIGNVGANMAFGDDRGAGANIGGTIGGMAGGTLGSIFGPIGSAIGAAIGSFLGNFVGGLFGDEPDIILAAATKAIKEDFAKGRSVKTAFGYVGFAGGPSHDLDFLVERETYDKVLNMMKTFDNAIASFLSKAQIDAVSKALKAAPPFKVNVGDDIQSQELGQLLAHRAVTMFKALEIEIPPALLHAAQSEDVKVEKVKELVLKGLITGLDIINEGLEKLVEGFKGTTEEFKKFIQVILAINAELPALNAVFGKQDPAVYFKAAKNMGGVGAFNTKVAAFAEFFGLDDDMAKAHLAQMKKDMRSDVAELGTTRETFLADFQKAHDAGLTPEELQSWLDAGVEIRKVTELEDKLTAQRKAQEKALKGMMEGFEDAFRKMNLSEFQYALYNLTQSFHDAMEKARKLGASTQQLGVIQAVYRQRQKRLITDLKSSIRSLVAQLFIKPQLQEVNKKITEAKNTIKNGNTFLEKRYAQLRLEDLQAKKEKLQAHLEKSQELSMAQKLAQQIADLAGVKGIAFSKMAAQFGFSLDDLAEKLGMSRSELDAYLKELQATNYTLPELTDKFDKMLSPYFTNLINAITGVAPSLLTDSPAAKQAGMAVEGQSGVEGLTPTAPRVTPEDQIAAQNQLTASKLMQSASHMSTEAARQIVEAASLMMSAAMENRNITITVEQPEAAVGAA